MTHTPTLDRTLTAVLVVCCSLLMVEQSAHARPRSDRSQLAGEVAQLTVKLESLQRTLQERRAMLEKATDLQKKIGQDRAALSALKQQQGAHSRASQELRLWATASLILGNQNTPRLIAIREEGATHRVVAVATHPFQQYAMETAVQAAVPNRADSSAGVVTTAIEKLVEGRTLPVSLSSDLSHQLNDLSNSIHKLVSDTTYMVFRDAATDAQRVAIVLNSEEPYKFLTIDHESQSLANSAFVAGSAWIGGRTEVERHIELGTPFIDYCVLGITHALSQGANQRKHVALSMKTTIDRTLKEFTVTARGRFLNSSTQGARVKVAVDAPSYSMPYEQRTSLEAFSRSIEDEFAERLVRHRIRLLEREHAADLEEEDARLDRRPVSAVTTKATHNLLVELDRTANGKERISVRLVDLTTGENIWAANDSAAIQPNRNWKNFHIHAGEPALAIFKSPDARNTFFNHVRQQEGEAFAGVTDKVIAINEQNAGEEFLLRSLFGKKSIGIPSSQVEFLRIPSLPDTNLDAILPSFLRKQVPSYVVHRFTRKLAAPAVRIKWNASDATPKSWNIPLGSADNISIGHRFRLMFPSSETDTLASQPFLASVTEVLDNHACRISLSPTAKIKRTEGLEGLAVCDSWENSLVAIMPPRVQLTDSQRTAGRRAVNSKLAGYDFGRALQVALVQGLSNRVEATIAQYEKKVLSDRIPWDENIDDAKTLKALGSRGVTHVIGGEIRNLRGKEFEVRLGLQELIPSKNGRGWEFGKVVDSVRVTLNRTNL